MSESRTAERYSRGRYLLYFAEHLLHFFFLAAFVFLGFASLWRDKVLSWITTPWLVTALFAGGLVAAQALFTFPLDIYKDYFREKAYGFAQQTLAGHLKEWMKHLAVSLVLWSAGSVILYAAFRAAPHLWWLWGWAVVMVFAVILNALGPVFIAPLFNKFEPLKDSVLKERILTLAHKQGITTDKVYQVNRSKQSSHTNAYVAGLFGTKRIVLFDTLLGKFTHDEIEFVMGHEMGHYVLHHLWKGLGLQAIIFLIQAYLLQWLFSRTMIYASITPPPLGGGVTDPAGLPLLLLYLSLMSFFLSPLTAAISRHFERQSDVFGLSVAARPEAGATSFQKMVTTDLVEENPPPLVEWWMFTHPSLGRRIRFCQQWTKSNNTSNSF